jgi:hypothetical protein
MLPIRSETMTSYPSSTLKQALSEGGCSIPEVTAVSDSSASSSSCCETHGCMSPLLISQPLHIPLEVGGEQFVPVNLPIAEKRVKFGEVEIRKYPLILGDHPECCMGPPVRLLVLIHQAKMRCNHGLSAHFSHPFSSPLTGSLSN